MEGISFPQQRLLLSALLDVRVAERPHDIAFVDGDREVSYAEFRILTQRAANWLQGQGIKRGDRVAVWLVNSVEWLALLFGIARIGATLVSVNTRYRSDEVSYILSRSAAKLLILQTNFRSIDFPSIVASIDVASVPALETVAVLNADESTPARLIGRPVIALDPAALPDAANALNVDDPESATILFTTSGTTKDPKLVMHPQRTLTDHALRCARAYQFYEPNSRMLAVLPFCGVFGLNGALAAFAAGAPVVIMDTFDAGTALKLIERHQITHTFGSDEMYRRLIDAAPGERPFPSARIFGFGAFTSSFDDYARKACARGIPLQGLYGSSEVLALFSVQQADLAVDERIKGGGLPVAHDATVRIRDVDTGELVAPGERGEIEILAPTNFIGYLGNPEATASALLPDGFFRTGDVGYLRTDGSFVYETRMGDAIRLGGFLVNPVEIEDVLKRIDGVADAQVVAVEIAGQSRAVAFVVSVPGADVTETSVIEATKPVVAAFKVPARVWFVEDFPVTQSSNGIKTQRNKLRDMAYARLRDSH
ncbi:AMP-binding enzyme family protein [Paraburkholderia fungorum]|uniref:Long-chain-fatty-acid--CoA ligase n=2 Tax=Paraburkholderia fungorum TaxID=134537 RepID=A0AAP5QJB8_9BURK|nr:AMP-binding enzyme family protein [Paraburkholderia fungorum]EIF28046.1 acyl-CoA synthetase (AMP-forming)/AMP-acid ligase II [Burkholderia sp. Ch1-1]MDT8843332.1 AMP-binding protein [Paraburkholderia fungorum]